MVIAKTLIKNHAHLNLTLAEVFEQVNNKLCENNDANMFVTAFMGILELNSGKFTYVNAGHNPPFVGQGGSFQKLKVAPHFVLAGMEGVKYQENSITLKKNDVIFLYTDGITEATNTQNELYTDVRLLSALNDCACAQNMADLLNCIKNDVNAFSRNAPQADDMTMLALLYRGAFAQITLDAKREELPKALEFVREQLSALSCPPQIQLKLEIACEEIFVNIVSYANSERVKIQITAENPVTIRFFDSGTPYNPLQSPNPDVTSGENERPVGGLGVFMVKNIADKIEYEHSNGYNVLTLLKEIK
jgi:sigma-B regulation protein RsbU (phosphoserine phosphatase)